MKRKKYTDEELGLIKAMKYSRAIIRHCTREIEKLTKEIDYQQRAQSEFIEGLKRRKVAA